MFTVAIAAGASINLVHADDLTSRFTNPSFEDGVNGWTVDNPNGCTSETRTAGVATDNNFGAVQTVPDGANFYYARKGWATTTSSIHQTITGLAAGTYKLSLSSLSLHVNATTDVASYTVSVKNAPGTVLDSKTITASDVASGAAATDGPINTMEWTATELAFGIDAVSDITVQVDFNYVPNGTSFLLDNFEFHDEHPYAQPLYVSEDGRVIRFMLKPGQAIEEHKRQHRDHRNRLHHGQVTPIDRKGHQAPQAGVIEYVLDDDQSADQPAKANGQHGNRWQQRIAQYVAANHRAPRQPLERSCAHVPLAQLLDHAGAGQPGHVGQQH